MPTKPNGREKKTTNFRKTNSIENFVWIKLWEKIDSTNLRNTHKFHCRMNPLLWCERCVCVCMWAVCARRRQRRVNQFYVFRIVWTTPCVRDSFSAFYRHFLHMTCKEIKNINPSNGETDFYCSTMALTHTHTQKLLVWNRTIPCSVSTVRTSTATHPPILLYLNGLDTY